jgi:hypothetical protein
MGMLKEFKELLLKATPLTWRWESSLPRLGRLFFFVEDVIMPPIDFNRRTDFAALVII